MGAQRDQLVAAKVVGTALHVADAQAAKQRLEKGHIAKKELILQGLGAGGDDDALPRAQCGQQVGEGFAGAGAGFDNQMAPLAECALDGLGHFKLAGAVFIWQRGAGEDSARRKELVEAGQSASWSFGGGHGAGVCEALRSRIIVRIFWFIVSERGLEAVSWVVC